MILAVFQDASPGNIAVTLDHSVRASDFLRLLREKRGVNSTENYKGALLASQSADLIATQRIGGVNSNSNNIPGLNALEVDLFQGFINDYRIAKALRGSSGEHKEPAWGDDADAKGPITGIDQMNFQCDSLTSWMPLAAIAITERRPSSVRAQPILAYVVLLLNGRKHKHWNWPWRAGAAFIAALAAVEPPAETLPDKPAASEMLSEVEESPSLSPKITTLARNAESGAAYRAWVTKTVPAPRKG
jgi:hypothetical protein